MFVLLHRRYEVDRENETTEQSNGCMNQEDAPGKKKRRRSLMHRLRPSTQPEIYVCIRGARHYLSAMPRVAVL
jgi:hypothetical protein